MKYGNKLRKIEKTVDDIRDSMGAIRYVFIEQGEDESQCLARHGLEKNMLGITIYTFSWEDGVTERVDSWATLQAIDAEINKLENELQRQ